MATPKRPKIPIVHLATPAINYLNLNVLNCNVRACCGVLHRTAEAVAETEAEAGAEAEALYTKGAGACAGACSEDGAKPLLDLRGNQNGIFIWPDTTP